MNLSLTRIHHLVLVVFFHSFDPHLLTHYQDRQQGSKVHLLMLLESRISATSTTPQGPPCLAHNVKPQLVALDDA